MAIDLLLLFHHASLAVAENTAAVAQAVEDKSVFEQLTKWCVHVIEISGYPGIFLLMALESMIAPIPSEAVMPFAGFLAFEGKMSMFLIAVVSTIGSITGSLVSYWMGIYGGRPLVLKIGKYLFLNVHHLDATERFFNRFGASTVFICRFIPVVRHFISIPAGMGRMQIPKFIVMTVTGALIWNTFLAWVGWKLKENWETLRVYFHWIDIVIAAIILLFIVAFIARQIIEWQKQKKAAKTDDI
jgi:membrane protein DedA with SNARE-associated domain